MKKKAKRIKYDYMNYRTLAGLRERPKFDVIRVMDLLRDMMLDIGKQLQKEDALEHVEDISFLTFKHILQADRKMLKAIVRKAKKTICYSITSTTYTKMHYEYRGMLLLSIGKRIQRR